MDTATNTMPGQGRGKMNPWLPMVDIAACKAPHLVLKFTAV
jgi:hypothetical protein